MQRFLYKQHPEQKKYHNDNSVWKHVHHLFLWKDVKAEQWVMTWWRNWMQWGCHFWEKCWEFRGQRRKHRLMYWQLQELQDHLSKTKVNQVPSPQLSLAKNLLYSHLATFAREDKAALGFAQSARILVLNNNLPSWQHYLLPCLHTQTRAKLTNRQGDTGLWAHAF